MNMPWTNRHGAAKMVVICVAVLLVSAGLCGVQLLILNAGNIKTSSALTSVFMVTGAVEIIAILVAILVGIIALLVSAFGRIFRRSSEP